MENVIFLALAVACFLAAAAGDVVEAYFVRAVGDLRPHKAAACSIGMYTISLVGFFSVVAYSYWLIIPEVLGLYFGSVYAIKRIARASLRNG